MKCWQKTKKQINKQQGIIWNPFFFKNLQGPVFMHVCFQKIPRAFFPCRFSRISSTNGNPVTSSFLFCVCSCSHWSIFLFDVLIFLTEINSLKKTFLTCSASGLEIRVQKSKAQQWVSTVSKNLSSCGCTFLLLFLFFRTLTKINGSSMGFHTVQ